MLENANRLMRKIKNIPCLTSASRMKLMSYLLEKPRGSKPTSPGREPSSLGGHSMKGTDLLIAMETLATDGAVREDTRAPEKADGRATAAPAKPETKANIVKGRKGGAG